jgi:two-component system, NarL family, sensor histidine kinase DegS
VVRLDSKNIDKILRKTLSAIETGKKQIYEIAEAARKEYERLLEDVEKIKTETDEMIKQVDQLERGERQARIRLMEVSRDFQRYTESDIRNAYEYASRIQVDLSVMRERERNLRKRRDELEARSRDLKDTVAKAENVVSQVGVALGYLGSEMHGICMQVENLQQKQMLGARIIKAQEEERKRVAREIHDGPAQTMANVVFRAEVAERVLGTDIHRARIELQDLKTQVRECLREVRKIIYDLRPMALDDLGLVPALRRFVDIMRDRTKLFAEIQVDGREKRLSSTVEVSIFRLCQEALQNVEKHAKATIIRLRLDFQKEWLYATIEDNGIGFDEKEVLKRNSESYGLLSMRERIELIGGNITIQSEQGIGTKIFVQVPIKE